MTNSVVLVLELDVRALTPEVLQSDPKPELERDSTARGGMQNVYIFHDSHYDR